MSESYDDPLKVLDPFGGGGAIPLEAMRLGCKATAVDINPVAWFLLRCTLEYPQQLAGQMRPLPDFALEDREFMADFFQKARGLTDASTRWVLDRDHKELRPYYPTVEGQATTVEGRYPILKIRQIEVGSPHKRPRRPLFCLRALHST